MILTAEDAEFFSHEQTRVTQVKFYSVNSVYPVKISLPHL